MVVENMKSVPLFSRKIEYTGSRDCDISLIRGGEWLKQRSNGILMNADADTIADMLKVDIDKNANVRLIDPIEEMEVPHDAIPFPEIHSKITPLLQSQKQLFVLDGSLGSTPQTQVRVRSVTNDPFTALILKALLLPITDTMNVTDNKNDNNISLFITRGLSGLSPSISMDVSDQHNLSLVVNGNASITQIMNSLSQACNQLYLKNNRDLNTLVDPNMPPDTLNTVILPCSCLRAVNNVPALLFSSEMDVNTITHEHLDEVHRHAMDTGALFTLDHTIINNSTIGHLFGGVLLNDKIGTTQTPTEGIYVNNQLIQAVTNSPTCPTPAACVFIQNKTGMGEVSYEKLSEFFTSWRQDKEMIDYTLAFLRFHKVECFQLSHTIVKDMIGEMQKMEIPDSPDQYIP